MQATQRSTSLLRLATLAALGLAATQPAIAQDLVTNGGFEATGPTDTALTNGSTAIDSWTVTGTGNQSVALLANGNPYGVSTPYGDQFIDLTGYSDSAPYAGLTQNLSTVQGTTYVLNLSLGADQSDGRYDGPVAVTASEGGTTQSFTFTPAVGSTGNVWENFTATFTATSGSTPLTISGLASGGGQYIGLDNVSVTAVAPEPSQFAGLGLGVLSLAGPALKARRRKPQTV